MSSTVHSGPGRRKGAVLQKGLSAPVPTDTDMSRSVHSSAAHQCGLSDVGLGRGTSRRWNTGGSLAFQQPPVVIQERLSQASIGADYTIIAGRGSP